MSHSFQALSTSDVHVGTPPPDYQHWAKTTVHFHELTPLFLGFSPQLSPRFSCLGSEWDLSARFASGSDNNLHVCLGYRSTTSSEITYSISSKNLFTSEPKTKLFNALSNVVSISFKCPREKISSDGALVVEVLMRPASYPFHAIVPVNPSACKTINDLFNDEEVADIIFEVGGATNNESSESEIQQLASAKKFYAHRIILKKAAPLLADVAVHTDERDSLVKIHHVSPDIFEVFLRSIYGFEEVINFLRSNPTRTMEIIDIANKYGVTSLKLQAEAYMVSATKFDAQNLMEILNFADAKNCALLKEGAIRYIVENPSETVKNGMLSQLPEGVMKDMLVVMAEKDTKKKAARELSTMSVGELRRKAHAKGLDIDGSREMLISALSQHNAGIELDDE